MIVLSKCCRLQGVYRGYSHHPVSVSHKIPPSVFHSLLLASVEEVTRVYLEKEILTTSVSNFKMEDITFGQVKEQSRFQAVLKLEKLM